MPSVTTGRVSPEVDYGAYRGRVALIFNQSDLVVRLEAVKTFWHFFHHDHNSHTVELSVIVNGVPLGSHAYLLPASTTFVDRLSCSSSLILASHRVVATRTRRTGYTYLCQVRSGNCWTEVRNPRWVKNT